MLDEDALLRALNGKKIAGAALDALATEPLPADKPAVDHAERVSSRRTSAATTTTILRDAAMQFEQSLGHFLAGKPELMLNRETL